MPWDRDLKVASTSITSMKSRPVMDRAPLNPAAKPRGNAMARLWWLHQEGTNSDAIQLPLVGDRIDIGRHNLCDVVLQEESVSSRHAELFVVDDKVYIRDLESTNGTFVNERRIEGVEGLEPLDILRFGSVRFRLYRAVVDHGMKKTIAFVDQNLIGSDNEFNAPASGESQSIRLQDHLMAWIQPIVSISDNEIYGFEALARGSAPGLESPIDIFLAAHQSNTVAEVSEKLRDLGVAAVSGLPQSRQCFVNTHPSEFDDSLRLLESLAELRTTYPSENIVIEFHELAVVANDNFAKIANEIRDLEMEFAFDDFGVGQSRMMEILRLQPNYVKFDANFIRSMADHPAQRHGMRSLVRMLRDASTKTIAEGVETAHQRDLCAELEFDLLQGYLVGAAQPASVFMNTINS